MIPLEELKSKTNRYKLITIAFILIDFIFYLSFEILDLDYAIIKGDMVLWFCIKIIAVTLILGFILFSVTKSMTKLLLINCIIYFIFGLMLFIYLLIEELKYYPKEHMTVIIPSKKAGYYDKEIFKSVLILNICSGVFRLGGCVWLILFRRKLVTLELRLKRLKIEEDQEHIMDKSGISMNKNRDSGDFVDTNNVHNLSNSLNDTNISQKGNKPTDSIIKKYPKNDFSNIDQSKLIDEENSNVDKSSYNGNFFGGSTLKNSNEEVMNEAFETPKIKKYY